MGSDGLADGIVEVDHVLDDGLELFVDVGKQILSMHLDHVKIVVSFDAGIDYLVRWLALDLIDGLSTVVNA